VSLESKNAEVAVPTAKSNPSLWLRPELVASWREITAVLVLTIGYYVYCSAQLALYRWNGHTLNLRVTNYTELHLMTGQSAILALLLLFLSWRGWIPADFKIKPGWWSTLQALLLLAADLVVTIIGILIIFRWNISHPLHVASRPYLHPHDTHLCWAVLIASQIINACFEEVMCMCYAFNQFAAKYGPRVALGLMLLLRISYHTWKSPAHLCITVIAFSIYGLWYWRTRNVWPLILTHICFDIIFLSTQVR
jgi:membrane protease YdiL (CAAX protease family)